MEVYSHLFRLRPEHGTLAARPGVSLATLYCADTDEGHDQVTGRSGSHAATRANLLKAQQLGIPLRVEIVDVLEEQRFEEARAELEGLGITHVHIGRLRGVGNAAGGIGLPSTPELYGRCAHGVAAILSDRTDHPRTRGDHRRLLERRAPVMGPPPHARGSRGRHRPHLRPQGTTPARGDHAS
ncbi:hypothetical protein [Streptomyces sp. cmx-18-6]|uniref:hypothetical protein n=1 Tax=Streptomyces sp. cmx-18-6 TaxID=2790930 RepID=UPI00398002FB